MELLNMKEEMAERYLNKGFSGGEKKRQWEFFNSLIFGTNFALLDEIGSVLILTALKVVSKGVQYCAVVETSAMIIAHYQRLLIYITWCGPRDDGRSCGPFWWSEWHAYVGTWRIRKTSWRTWLHIYKEEL